MVKAVVCRELGSLANLTLEELPARSPGRGEVLVAIQACGVNPADRTLVEAKTRQLLPLQLPFTPGLEVAGTVQSVGAGVEHVRIGQRVLATGHCGGYAQEGVFNASRVVGIPDSMSFSIAASFFIASMTARYCLVERARLASGESLLVLGAGGGVGLAVVEMGKALGATVYAAASTDQKLAAARECGADVLIRYPATLSDPAAQRDFRKALLSQPGAERGFDVVMDAVGGGYTEPALRSVAKRGRYLVVGFAAGATAIPLDIALKGNCDIVGVTVEDSYVSAPANQQALLALYERGALRPRVNSVYPLERFAEALGELSSRDATGKVVLTTR